MNFGMDAIVIMAKAPVPKKVKTRLVPPLNPETASELYKNFLLDKIEQIRNMVAVHRFVAYTPKKTEAIFRDIVPKEFTLVLQVGADLGEKLANISNTLFHKGFKKVVLLDSDTPNLPSRLVNEALRRLDKFDVVIGPCEDGGYYLIGLRSNMPELFRKIPWSTSEVTESTIRKTVKSGATFTLLNKWYDIDTVQNLLRLKKTLDSKPQIRRLCKNSFLALSKMNFEDFF
jgi:rSAM/selenodomain-associated transferase 1